jgi:hypothetical protein
MSSERVREISPFDREALKGFVELERKLVGLNPLFVSDFDSDVIKRLSGKSAFFSETEHTLFVASDGSRDLSRCAALINRRYQKAKNEAVGFLGYLAAAPDSGPQVQAMLEQAEVWLSKRGVTRVIAPYDLGLRFGLLTTAFDEEPITTFWWHPPYYAEYFAGSGYEPTYPLWVYTIDFSSGKYHAAVERVAENKTVRIRPISKKQWNSDLEIIRQLLNETFKEEWECHPYTSEEFHEFFDPIKPLIETYQMLIAEVEGKLAGFCLGLPDWNPLFRPFKGKLGSLQMIKIMFGARCYNRAGLMCIGVLLEHRGTGVAQGPCRRSFSSVRRAWPEGGVLLFRKPGEYEVPKVC